jgi:NAD(P)-dependent dehydrogenase (short-subunit alcohol dehydrogenase family)
VRELSGNLLIISLQLSMADSVILTGGCGLIGKFLSLHLAEKGYHIIVIDIIEPAQKHPNIDFIKFDLADIKKFELLKDKIRSKTNKIRGLINNAAINPMIEKDAGSFGKFEDIDFANWDKEMKVNLSSPIFLTKELLDLFDLTGNKNGKIINVLSTYGIVPPNQDIYRDYSKKSGKEIYKPLSYSVAKAALGMFTKYLAVYLAEKNINVNAIAPGGIENKQDETFIVAYKKLTPMGRMANPADLLGAFEYLLSQESNYMTGQTLIIDGGWTVW